MWFFDIILEYYVDPPPSSEKDQPTVTIYIKLVQRMQAFPKKIGEFF